MKPFHLAPLLLLCALAPHASAAATIPFLGCIESGPKADDGSWTAPSGKPLVTSLPPAVAARLTLYASNWSAVLAPAGWACRSTVNPLQGVGMIVAPASAIDSGAGILNGPAIIVWNDESDTTVAAYAGRYFPSHATPHAAGAPGQPPTSQPVLPSYPADAIHYNSDLVLQYMTPAGHLGLGSQLAQSGAKPPALASYGLLALSSLPRGAGGIVNITVRLPPDLAFLRKPILAAFAACMPSRNTVDCESGGAFVAQGHPVDDGD